MPGSFDDREKSFEAKWAHDEELRFRVYSRRNRMLGLWAAGQMGLTGAEADDFVAAIVATELQKTGDEAAFNLIRSEFDVHGVKISDHMIRRQMDELLNAAKAEMGKK